MKDWIRKHEFAISTLAFLLMIAPPLPMYLAIQAGNEGLAYFLLALVILGNLLVLGVR